MRAERGADSARRSIRPTPSIDLAIAGKELKTAGTNAVAFIELHDQECDRDWTRQ